MIALPTVLGTIGVGGIIVSCMDNSRIALGGALTDIVGGFDPQNFEGILGKFAGNGRTNAPSTDNDNVVAVPAAVIEGPIEGVPVLVVSFLAVLELAKEILIEVSQEQAYSPIYVKLKGSPMAAVQ